MRPDHAGGVATAVVLVGHNLATNRRTVRQDRMWHNVATGAILSAPRGTAV